MSKQVIIETFGQPDEIQGSGNHEFLIYRKRGFFIGLNQGKVDAYGDLTNGRVEKVPDPVEECGNCGKEASKGSEQREGVFVGERLLTNS